MNLRRATPEDANAIATVHVRSWQAAYQGIVPEAFLRSLSIEAREATWRTTLQAETSEVYVAEESQEIIGWISVSRCQDPDSSPITGELYAIYVAPEHWGSGAGRALWKRGESYLRASGFLDVVLWVLKENRRALRFYEVAGFAPDPGREKVIELGGASLLEIRLRRSLTR
ncbi:MAG TPA: GNAT family N-acetyltransferase [Thermoanaerobaculia bacterium]|nr:GNAT family N-acetyltransferase [Thermoanaerobaculia bacterium]